MMDVSSCPEDTNSTDCLLRILLQRIDDHFEEFNWDPITFGFTVPVGIIAALFAAFTIYQAIVTAGRGARKCNRRAIGGWSSRTTKSWDWHEMCRISTAQTPILTTSNLLETPLLSSKRLGSKKGPPQTTLSRDPAVASWLGFLDELGLDHSDLQDVPLKGNIADYLPSDLLAVPAYAEIGFIVAAAAAAGAHSWELDRQSGFPTVLCSSFQFEFRQHQILGTVGAFVKYSYDSHARRTPTARQLVEAILYSKGKLEFSRFWKDNYLKSPLASILRHILYIRSPNISDGLGPVLSELMYLAQYTDHGCKTCLCKRGLVFRSQEDQHHLTWLFVQSTPRWPPAIFPSRLMKSPHIFIFLALHSRFWTSLTTMQLFSSVNEQTPSPNLIPGLEIWDPTALPAQPGRYFLDHVHDFLDKQAGNQPERWKLPSVLPFGAPRGMPKGSLNIYVFGAVLEASVKFLYSVDNFHKWFSALQQMNKQQFRVLLLLQIQQLDNFFVGHKPEELFCQIQSLWMTTLALLDAKCAITEGSFGFSATKGKQNPSWSNDLRNQFPDHLSVRHFETLQVLSQFLSELKKEGFNEVGFEKAFDERKENLTKYESPLRCLLGFPPSQLTEPHGNGYLSQLLQVLDGVLEVCRKGMVSNKASIEVEQPLEENNSKDSPHSSDPKATTSSNEPNIREPGGERKKVPPKNDSKGEKSKEDTIRDVLVWKCMLLGMLFSTAPDNSDLLTSGVWERVVPIL